MANKAEDLVLDINADTFNNFRTDFNLILTSVLTSMKKQDLVECDLNMKINIKFYRESPKNPDDPVKYVNPMIKHIIQAVIKQTAKMEDTLVPLDSEIVYDEDEGKFVIRKKDDGMDNLFDDEEDEEPKAKIKNALGFI